MDHRYVGRIRGKHYGFVDEQTMEMRVVVTNDEDEDIEVCLPVKFAVCTTCNGKGAHVNPNVDSHGISSEEWEQFGEDEREWYMNGRYDVACFECYGKRVVPVIDESRVDNELKKIHDVYQKHLTDGIRDAQTYLMESGHW